MSSTDKKILRSTAIGMIVVALVSIFGTFGITYSVMNMKVKQAYNEGATQGMKETFEALAVHRAKVILKQDSVWHSKHKK
jgi:hypothetical protein